MPRTSAKARRLSLATRIARDLFTDGTGGHATRLVFLDDTKPTLSRARDMVGWDETSVIAVIAAHLRPGQRRRTQ
jgi:hypothetical protein